MEEKNNAIALMNEYGQSGFPFFFMIDFNGGKSLVLTNSEIDNGKIRFDFSGINKYKEDLSFGKKLIFKKFPVDYKTYKNSFDHVMKNIQKGNTYLLNLTFPTKIETNYTLNEIYENSTAKYKLIYEDKFVVFSPETFVKIKNKKIYSFPMKGTIDADIQNAEKLILNDPKETAEHYTIVDLIRNDLSIVSENVEVEKFRYVEKIKTNQKNLLQVSSKISGTLDDNYTGKIGSIIFNLLPAGSVSGAPKEKTVEIINIAEKYERGFYTGIFGYFDGKDLDSAVMIRFIERIGDEMYFKSGGGITAMSNSKLEYREMIDKVYVPFI